MQINLKPSGLKNELNAALRFLRFLRRTRNLVETDSTFNATLEGRTSNSEAIVMHIIILIALSTNACIVNAYENTMCKPCENENICAYENKLCQVVSNFGTKLLADLMKLALNIGNISK